MERTSDDPNVTVPVVDGAPAQAEGATMMRATCPHCGTEDAWGVPIGAASASGTETFPVGCGNCRGGFRIRFAPA